MKALWSFITFMLVMVVTAKRSSKRPNIIFVLTDDQDVALGSMWSMNKTRNIFRDGAEFVNAFVTSPICCPSRSSIITGMYAHNHNTLTNNANCSSVAWRVGPETRSYARYLADAGYLTGHFGKYLNEYDGTYIPAGWHHWVGLVRNSRFYNYTLRHNTFLRRHRNIYGKDYFTDVITNHSLAFFRRAKKRNPERPVLMVVSHAAPHGPEDGAPQYQAAYKDITTPRTPNWNFVSLDKHWIVRVTAKMDKQKIAFSDLLYRKRLQTLLSVDDSIQRIYNMLKDTGTLDNTYIFFSSDHGYHLGHFGLVKGKSMPYETDIRVPFYVRGPNIPKNAKIEQMVLNIDLAPTFLDIAGVKPPRTMDGVSVMKLFTRRLRNPNDQPRVRRKIRMRWRDTFLVERGKIRRAAKSRTPKKSSKTNKATFLSRLCAEEKYRSPCVPGQQWHCITIKRRQRLKKCKKIEPVVPTTAKVEMCTCYRPRLPWKPTNEQQPRDESLYESHIKRLHKRSLRSERRTANKHKYYREMIRAVKQLTRRKKAKMMGAKPQEENKEEEEVDLEKKLERLNAKIAGIKFRLEALRGRKKKLIRIKEEKKTENYLKEKYEEFPCSCPTPSPSPAKTKRPRRSKEGRYRQRLRSGDQQTLIKRMNRRNMRKFGLRSGVGGKKKKAPKKKSSRRSKCSVSGMSCFHQTNYHWKTPPLWTGGEFCFCPSASNNTYWCLRTINQHQNFLYCEFITQFLEYFDLNTDPYQLYNIVDRISPSVLYDLHHQLERLKACKGAQSCTQYHGKPKPLPDNKVNVTGQPVNTTALPVTREDQQITTQPTKNTSSDVDTTQRPTEALTRGANDSKVDKGPEKKEDNKESLIEKEKLERRRRRKQKKAEKSAKLETTKTAPTNSGKVKKGKKKSEKKKTKKRERNRVKDKENRRNDGNKSFTTVAP